MSDHDPATTWPAVELREIRVFLTLAEELHYGRTAERLVISPARVSQTIQTLEAKVGGRVFERTSRRVRLTPLGAELDTRLRPIYLQLIATVDAFSTRASHATGSLRLGVTINTGRPAVDRLLSRFQQQHSECDVSVVEVDVWEPYGPLRRGEIDVLVNWLAVDEPDLTPGPAIEECSRVLVVASDHPLAQRSSVSSEDLVGERLNRPPKRYPPALADAVLVPRTRSGRALHRTEEELEAVPEAVTMIARGEIVSINVSGSFRFARDDITLVPITDLPPLPLGLIWCAAHENARIRALAETARALNPDHTESTLSETAASPRFHLPQTP